MTDISKATPRPWKADEARFGYRTIRQDPVVQAVNAHAALVAALRLALGTLVDHAPHEQAVIQQGQAALTKAGAP